jgi:hypothetical protein
MRSQYLVEAVTQFKLVMVVAGVKRLADIHASLVS